MNDEQIVLEQTLLDRMVDGELSPGEQQALLARIANDAGELPSDPWRRLALAYVEAQSFCSDFGVIVRDDYSPVEAHTTQIDASTQGHLETSGSRSRQTLAACDNLGFQTLASSATANCRNPSQIVRPLAIAAALVLAFGLGVMSSPDTSLDQSDDGNLVEREQTPRQIEPAGEPQQRLVADRLPDDGPARRPYLELTIDGQSSPVAIPIYNLSEVSRDWLESEPMAIPAYIRDELERRGHRVRQRRRLIPVKLDSGHQVMIPVDEAEVQFVDHRSYQ